MKLCPRDDDTESRREKQAGRIDRWATEKHEDRHECPDNERQSPVPGHTRALHLERHDLTVAISLDQGGSTFFPGHRIERQCVEPDVADPGEVGATNSYQAVSEFERLATPPAL